MGRQPPVPQAFFDEFGKGADDLVMDYGTACAQAARSAWQPIETAEPVTPVLLWDPDHGMIVGFKYDGQWVHPVGDELYVTIPTLWHPLPEPPHTNQCVAT